MKMLFYFLLIFVVVGLSSCAKDKDEKMPLINISTPTENKIFTALDTIEISAVIEDETSLIQIEVTVCNELKTPVLPTFTIIPDQKKYNLDCSYPLSDISLETGNYYLLIKVSDGTNIYSKYRGIRINEVPRALQYVYIVSAENSSWIHIQRRGPDNSTEILPEISGDFTASAASSGFQLFATSGSTFGDLNVFDLSSHSLQWSVPVVSDPPFLYFTGLSQFNNIFFCSYYNGFIKGFNFAGIQKYSVTTTNGYFPLLVYADNNYIYADQASYAGSSHRFAAYYLNSGTLKQQLTTDYSIVSIFKQDNDHLFLFANKDGQGTIKHYSIPYNTAWEPHTIPSGSVNDVAQIDADEYIIAHTSGLYKYQYSMNSLTIYASGINATKIKYDSENSDLYVAFGDKVGVYDYSTHSLISEIPVVGTVLDFQLIYNK